MVDVMGGEIGAGSVEGHGSTFWVRLPVTQPSPTPIA
jgi:signal transduction histidine kinase